MTGNGRAMVDHALRCLDGGIYVQAEDPLTGEIHTRLMPADSRAQSQARAYLTEQAQMAGLEAAWLTREDQGPDFSKLDVIETRELLRLMEKAERRSVVSGRGNVAESEVIQNEEDDNVDP